MATAAAAVAEAEAENAASGEGVGNEDALVVVPGETISASTGFLK